MHPAAVDRNYIVPETAGPTAQAPVDAKAPNCQYSCIVDWTVRRRTVIGLTELPGSDCGNVSRFYQGVASIERLHRLNEQIRITPVRVISAEGAQLGVIPTEQALQIANEADLDLVEVAPNERPPVCRIMDFGKFKYQQKKKQHKAHIHHSKIKEIRVRPKTGEHDIEFKVNQARGFLEHKDKVIVSVVFRGREIAHIEEGQRVIRQIIAQLEEVGKVEAVPQQQGKRITCTLAPKYAPRPSVPRIVRLGRTLRWLNPYRPGRKIFLAAYLVAWGKRTIIALPCHEYARPYLAERPNARRSVGR